MAIEQQLSQRLQQKLSPQQLQVVKLLEYSVLELEDKIKHEIEENPALEEGAGQEDRLPENESGLHDEDVRDAVQDDDFSENEVPETYEVPDIADSYGDFDDYSPSDGYGVYTENNRNIAENTYSSDGSFHEYLEGQLGTMDMDGRMRKFCDYIVGNLDEEGYLRREISQLADDINMTTRETVNETELFEALDIVQNLEPAGVGARSLEECLMLQLQRKKMTPAIDNAMRIIEEAFDEFSLKHYDKVRSRLGISEDDVKAAVSEILKLNPKPGNAWSEGPVMRRMDTITPDFIYDSETRNLSLNNKDIPPLRVSRAYRELFEDYKGNSKNRTAAMRDAVNFAKQKIDSAKSFIDALKQREDTLLKVMRAIITLQRDYFDSGDESMLKPMTMKDVAALSGCDISTVSRVSSSKYIQTDFGIFPLKYFFSEGIMTTGGEEVSTKEIKRILKECIEGEDKSKPLPDEKLCDILKAKGFVIARRTVAKYREQLGLPVARLRRRL